MADLCALVASPEIASQMYALLKPYAEMLGTVSIGGATHGPIDFHLARLALRAGDVSLAGLHCERGLATAERMPAPIFVMAGCLTYAFICLHSTEASAAVRGGTFAKRALAIAEAGGMPPMIEHCRFLLAHFGEPPAPQAFLSLN
jgi:hypothetical protein